MPRAWPKNVEYGTYQWLQREIASAMGESPHVKTLDSELIGRIDSVIQSGLHRFLYPRPIGDQTTPHTWSFLKRVGNITFQSGAEYATLADDYAGGCESFTYSLDGDIHRSTVVDYEVINSMRGEDDHSGFPRQVGIRRVTQADGSTSFEAHYYPIPSEDVSAQYQYTIEPAEFSEEKNSPPSGKQHSEALLQACLEVLSERAGGEGLGVRFEQMLAASMQFDVNAHKEELNRFVWPKVHVGELNVSVGYIKRMVGRQIGAGPHPAYWSNKEYGEIMEIVRTGFRRFYNPMVLPNERFPHEWSFLTPKADITTEADVAEYYLPSDYAMMESTITYQANDSTLYGPIRMTSEHAIREKSQFTNYVSRPQLAADYVDENTVGDGQRTRYKIVFWPTPDAAYELTYRYKCNPIALSEDMQEPAGGAAHAQTILEACLLAADESVGQLPSVHEKRFIECLRASVGHDRVVNAPDTLGKLQERSDNYGIDGSRNGYRYRDFQNGVVTYNGVTVPG